jgi:hypothetical protein
MITTKLGQTRLLGKGNDEAVAMVRLVRELSQRLEENGMLESSEMVAVDNVLCGFLAKQSKAVREEVLEG